MSAGAAAVWYEVYCKALMQAREVMHAPPTPPVGSPKKGHAHLKGGATAH